MSETQKIEYQDTTKRALTALSSAMIMGRLAIIRLEEEIAVLKERLRPRDPEKESPLEREYVLVYAGDSADPSYFEAIYTRGVFLRSDGREINVSAWWKMPEQETGDQ